jgi:hypothetical protein
MFEKNKMIQVIFIGGLLQFDCKGVIDEKRVVINAECNAFIVSKDHGTIQWTYLTEKWATGVIFSEDLSAHMLMAKTD